MRLMKPKLGRPRINKAKSIPEYQRIAVKPETYKLIQKKSESANMTIVNWMHKVVEEA